MAASGARRQGPRGERRTTGTLVATSTPDARRTAHGTAPLPAHRSHPAVSRQHPPLSVCSLRTLHALPRKLTHSLCTCTDPSLLLPAASHISPQALPSFWARLSGPTLQSMREVSGIYQATAAGRPSRSSIPLLDPLDPLDPLTIKQLILPGAPPPHGSRPFPVPLA